MSGDHSDNLDKAAELQLILAEAQLAEVQKRLAPQQHPSFDGKHCIDCEDCIPQARLDAGRIRCTACQTVVEKGQKR